MSEFSTSGDRITPIFDLPLNHRVQAMRVDYEPGGTTPWPHRHPYGAFVYVIDGAVRMGEPTDQRGRSCVRATPSMSRLERCTACRRTRATAKFASLLAVFVVPEGQSQPLPEARRKPDTFAGKDAGGLHPQGSSTM